MDIIIALITSAIVFGALSYAAWLVFVASIRRRDQAAAEDLPEIARAFWVPWRA